MPPLTIRHAAPDDPGKGIVKRYSSKIADRRSLRSGHGSASAAGPLPAQTAPRQETVVDTNQAQFVGDIPHHYDTGLGPILFADHAAWIADRVAAGKPSSVLETAAGTGIVSRRLRDVLPADAHLTVTDLNPPMLALARSKFRDGEAVTIEPADAMALPYPDGSFDAVVCQFGLMFFPDKPASLREVHRVLAPGGRYFVSVWDSHRRNPFARIVDEVVRETFPLDPPQFYKVPFSCHEVDPIREALSDAGFRDIAIDVVTIDKTVPEVAAFARGLVFGNPLIDQIRTRGSVDAEAVFNALVERLHAAFGSDPAHMQLQTIMYAARKPA